jgi:aminoglycoside 6'-N-acetyltransferase I
VGNEDVPQLPVTIRRVTPADARVWTAMRCSLWPDGVADHEAEIASFFAGNLLEPIAVFVAEIPDRGIGGFAELSIRTDIAGLAGERTGYVEGLFVRPDVRQQGVATKLLKTSRNWARQQKCTAFASDRSDRLIIDKRY